MQSMKNLRDTISIHGNTKNVLAQSFIKLCKVKRIENITVQNIVDNCGGGRQTFYNHFGSKYDLVNWIYKSQIDQLEKKYNVYDCRYKNVLQVHILLVEYKQFYSNCIEISGGKEFYNYALQTYKNSIIDQVSARFGSPKIANDLQGIIDYYCRGGFETSINWIENGMKQSPSFMADLYIRCLPPELAKYILCCLNEPCKVCQRYNH